MPDVIFIAVVLAFLALTIAYVRGCAAIIGPDPVEGAGTNPDDVAPPGGTGSLTEVTR